MGDFLRNMAIASRQRAMTTRRHYRDDELDRPLCPLKLSGFDVIAELKSISPAEGNLAPPDFDRLAQARCYASAGACAVSVLTEPTRFGGELAHLSEVAELLAADGVPAMRKDFLIDPVQVLEARAAGASGVLLIIAMLEGKLLDSMLDCAAEHGLFVLLEAFDGVDLERVHAVLDTPRHADRAARGELLVGINTRNLRTLAVDSERLENLADQLPDRAVCVAESGLKTAADAARVADWGYRAALVGSALMRAVRPEKLLRGMLDAGRAKVAA